MLNELRDKILESAKRRSDYYEVLKSNSEPYSAAERTDYLNFEANLNENNFKENFEMFINEKLDDEIAVILLATLGVAGELDIDIQKAVEFRMKYNKLEEEDQKINNC